MLLTEEHCDVGAVVPGVVVSEDTVDDVGSSVIEAPQGPPHGDNYCFDYCSSCLYAYWVLKG